MKILLRRNGHSIATMGEPFNKRLQRTGEEGCVCRNPSARFPGEPGSPGEGFAGQGNPSVRLLERYRFGSVVSLPQSMPDHSTRS